MVRERFESVYWYHNEVHGTSRYESFFFFFHIFFCSRAAAQAEYSAAGINLTAHAIFNWEEPGFNHGIKVCGKSLVGAAFRVMSRLQCRRFLRFWTEEAVEDFM